MAYNDHYADLIRDGIVNALSADDFRRKLAGDCSASPEHCTEAQVRAVQALGAWECRWYGDQLVIINGCDRRE